MTNNKDNKNLVLSQSRLSKYDSDSLNKALMLASEITLESEVGIDYTKLRDYLKESFWEEADEETYDLNDNRHNHHILSMFGLTLLILT